MSAMQDSISRPAAPVLTTLQPAMPPNSENATASATQPQVQTPPAAVSVSRTPRHTVKSYDIPPLLLRPDLRPRQETATPAATATVPEQPDSTATAADSVPAELPVKGIVLVNASPEQEMTAESSTNHQWQVSGIIAILLALFSLCATRFRSNRHFPKSLLHDLTEVRDRHNIFDETVRETSFLTFLNLLFCASAGVVLYSAISTFGAPAGFPLPLPAFTTGNAPLTGVCMGVCVVYTVLMAAAYSVVGNVFSNRRHATLWARGFTAYQALLSVPMFIIALLCLCCPQWTQALLIVGAVALIIAKMAFIIKGFRIFFAHVSSWILFLYYLCSLEIIPLILTYLAALAICSLVS